MNLDKLKERVKGLLKEKQAAGLSEYERKRREFAERVQRGYSPSDGELLNFLDGMTADGFDKRGVKVGFIERGTPAYGRKARHEKIFLSRP